MLYLVTHGQREGGFDPSHTIEGIHQFMNCETIFDLFLRLTGSKEPCTKLVYYGAGTRYVQMYNLFVSMGFLSGIPAKCTPICGTAVSRTHTKDGDFAVLDKGIMIKEEDYLGLDSCNIDWWKVFLRNQPDNTIFFAGRDFGRLLKLEERLHTCSLYTIHVATKSARCLVCRGEYVGPPRRRTHMGSINK